MKSLLHFIVLAIAIVFISSCQSNQYSHREEGSNILIDSLIIPDSVMSHAITPFKEEIDNDMNRVIGTSEKQMLSFYPESPLSNFVADIVQNKAKEFIKNNNIEALPLFSLINIKGLRAPLPKGDITTRNIFQLMPFENEIVILKLNSKSVKEFFNYLITTNGEGIAGAKVTYQNDKIKELFIEDSAFNENNDYLLATSDYVASGGDNFTMVTEPIESHNINCKVRQAITLHIEDLHKNNQAITSNTDGRITFIK